MKLVKCIVRAARFDEVREAVERIGITGMTVTQVRGKGCESRQRSFRGHEYAVLVPMLMVDLIVSDTVVEDVVRTVLSTARTGEHGQHGDGRIMVIPLEDAYSIRTRWSIVA